MKKTQLIQALALAGMVGATGLAQAEVEFTTSGFMTMAVGKVLGGDSSDAQTDKSGYKFPRFISDWAQAGVYESDGLQYKPDSRIGLQTVAKFNQQWSATGQIVSRGARDGKVNLEWGYVSYKPTDEFTVQVGRKRLPILYYSESQDVSLSYPWVHLPSDLYGWQVVNYNGVNLMYQSQVGDWSYTANVFAGSENNKNAGYAKLYAGKDSETDIKWSGIRGGELIVSKDWFEGRVGYFQNDFQQTGALVAEGAQKIYTFGYAIDYQNWVVRNEYYLGRLSYSDGTGEHDHAQIYGVGYRIGKFLPMLTYSHFRWHVDGGDDTDERHDTRSFSVRYDLTPSSAIKMQYDAYRDRSAGGYRGYWFNANQGGIGGGAFGNARLITMSYEMVF